MKWRPRGALGFKVQSAYIIDILNPQIKNIQPYKRKLSELQIIEINKNTFNMSLRELARKYRVSYETIRRSIRRPLSK
jgi:hypothetical protein